VQLRQAVAAEVQRAQGAPRQQLQWGARRQAGAAQVQPGQVAPLSQQEAVQLGAAVGGRVSGQVGE
jgi:hypothetical protein